MVGKRLSTCTLVDMIFDSKPPNIVDHKHRFNDKVVNATAGKHSETLTARKNLE